MFRLVVLGLILATAVQAADQPQWGAAWMRNMVSGERNLPDSFDPKTGKNIRWAAELGTESHSTPIVAKERVFIGTNNGNPRDAKHEGDRGVLMCFEEATGKFLWQLVSPKRDEDRYMDWPKTGLSSPATVEGERIYIVSNRGEVLCLDLHGMANGNDGPFKDEGAQMTPRGTNAPPEPLTPGPLDADILWLFNMTTDAGIWSHDSAHSSILIHGDHLYLNTGTGVDNTHRKIRTPDAPGLIVLDKRTGRFLARDDERMAPNTAHCSWSSPALAQVNGKPLIFFCGGNAVVYGFEPLATNALPSAEPAKLKKVFEFDSDPRAPKENIHRFTSNRREGPSTIYAMPVFQNGRLYVAGGGDLFWGKNEAWLKCIDATKTGNITTNGEVWSSTLERHVISTPAVAGELTFIADCGRKLHCLETATGKSVWTHDISGECWASPMIADGKLFLGTRSGHFYIMSATREKREISHLEFGTPISATTTAANGVLYVATMTHLYAVAK
jgi:outer membrane protein assembly factor BamB